MDNYQKKTIKLNSLKYSNEEDTNLKRYQTISSSDSFGLSSVSSFSSDIEDNQIRPNKRNKNCVNTINKPMLNFDNEFNGSIYNNNYRSTFYSTKLKKHKKMPYDQNTSNRYFSSTSSNDKNNLKSYSEKYDLNFNLTNSKHQLKDVPKLEELDSKNDLEIDHDKLITKLKDLNIYQSMCLNELTKQDNDRTNLIKNLTIENQKLIDKNEYTIRYYNNELQKLTFKLKDNSDDHAKLMDRAQRFGYCVDLNETNFDNNKLIELKRTIEDEKKKLNSIVEYQKEYYDQEIVNLNNQLKLKDDELTKQKKEFIGKLKNQGELYKIQIDKLNKNLKKKDDEIIKLKNIIKNGIKDVKNLENIMTSIDTEFND